MCTSSIRLFTNSRFISKVNLTRYRVTCRCGFCSECIRQMKSEWALRSYYECLDTFDRGGSVLFDTLTYRDSSLRYFHDVYKPALYNAWDFSCFSRDDIKRFFKRLRINLSRAGYDVDGHLRYLVTSEYGSVLKTNRPHYHVLFFVTFDIDPIVFSKFVSTAWTHGITDGVMPDNALEPWYAYKSSMYVLQNRVFRSKTYDLTKLVNYVVKYITKDLYLYKRLFKRCFMSFTIQNPNWQLSYDSRLEFRRFKNQVLPFHFQSVGFGLSALQKIDLDDIFRFNALPLPFLNKGFTAYIPLPLYYKRKMFYKAIYCEADKPKPTL